MRIKVELYVDVDPAKWAWATGNCDAEGRYRAADVRADVRSHLLYSVQQLSLIDESDATVSAR